MLADPRSQSLVTNFAGQWLHLRNLDSITPDGRLFPDFDDNLRQALRRETELLFEEVMREDRSVLDLLKSDHTFLNERLAKHYGIPHVYGPRFRRVALEPGSERGGLLRHGSVLTVTSYATRTSPVIRGKWVLENLLGTPPPPPPPNVPALDDNTVSASLPVRERLAQHRANAACASCHNLMDPVGFALENFDAVGRWRTTEEGQPVDASGGLPDGSKFTGVAGLEAGLAQAAGGVRRHAHREAAHVRARPRRRALRRPGGPRGRPHGAGRGLPLLGADRSDRHQHPVPDEDQPMIVSKKALPRRTFLRGVGATLALPLLDAMVPAMTAAGGDAGRPRAPARASSSCRWAATSPRWTPPGKDKLDELSPILSPLAPVKDHVTVLTNMELQNAYPGTHATSNAAFLSAARAKHTESTDYYLGTTVDQIAAKQLGRETQLPSLELAMDMLQTVGQCDNGYACVYQNNLSWSSPDDAAAGRGAPAAGVREPVRRGRQQGRPAGRAPPPRQPARLREGRHRPPRAGRSGRRTAPRSTSTSKPCATWSGASRRPSGTSTENPLPDLDRPVGVPAAYADHARLMFDLQVLALQGDVTRVITFQLARETSNRTYPEIGVPDPHHPLSHHGNDPAKIARMAKINQFHVSLFAEFLGKLKATKEGNGTLLDHSLFLYGSGMGNPNVHDHTNLPILVAGGAAGGMKGGRHIRFDKPTPLANLHLTLLDKVGVRLDKFADSDGKVDELFEPWAFERLGAHR